MQYYCIIFVLSVCQVVLSQRFIEEGNFRSRKRGNSGRFRGRFLFRPGQRGNWKMEYNNLDRRRYVTSDHIPWQLHKPEQVTRPVTPGNLAITSDVGTVSPDIRPLSSPGLTGQLGDAMCFACCRVHWYYYQICIRRFCVGRGPYCGTF